MKAMLKVIQQVQTKAFPVPGEKGIFSKLWWNTQLDVGEMEFTL